MTKCEIRALSIAKLHLFPAALVYDVGAGSGSVAIECKLLAPRGRVFAIEKEPRALGVMTKNCGKFQVNLEIVTGIAPGALLDLPPVDRIFIGGSGGNLVEILDLCHQKLKAGGRMVINSVTVNTGADAYSHLKAMGCEVEALQVNTAVAVDRGGVGLWQPKNSVTIITAEKRSRE